jgi:riboflavin transporter FmnP
MDTNNTMQGMVNTKRERAVGASGVTNVRYLTVTAMLSAVAFILMFFDFAVPFMPSFIKMDLSELPALIGSFALGPVCGVVICLIKNLLHLTITSTGGVGELSNFLLGAAFVLPAGLIYRYRKNRKSALIGSLVGAVFMGVFSIVSNYLLVYPVYYNFMSEDAILAAYQVINPAMQSILQCLICFNMPFTIVKGLFSVVITFLVYKHISPILKGNR